MGFPNGFSVNVNDANDMHLGSDSTQRNWLGDVYAIRFYDRTLSSAEIAQNAKADNERYRSGNPIVNPEFETAPAGPAELLNKSWTTPFPVTSPPSASAAGRTSAPRFPASRTPSTAARL